MQGEGRVEGPPELATVSAVLHTSGRHSADVTRALADLTRRIDDTLSGFSPDSVRSDPVSVSPVVDRRSGLRTTGWAGRCSTRVTLADFTDLSALVLALAALPGAAVDGPWWSLRPGSDLQRQARTAAVAAAVTRARDYATALGATLGDLVELSDGGGDLPFATPRMAVMAARGAEPPELDLDPQPQTVTATVTARFELLDVPPSAELPGARDPGPPGPAG